MVRTTIVMSLYNSTVADPFYYCKTVLDACDALGNCENIDGQCKIAVKMDKLDMYAVLFYRSS
jgi:hypothetical protein